LAVARFAVFLAGARLAAFLAGARFFAVTTDVPPLRVHR
jgi:hypothetical protein